MSRVWRLPCGGEIDRDKPVAFTFDGTRLVGCAGDTIASALLANGVRVVGRSFKYHRPRGIFAAGVEEPNAILDLRHGARHDPNARATLEPLADGMVIRSIHARGDAANDRLSFVDRFQRFIPAAFYYKTFIRPGWRFYEPRIRAMAGLGRLDPAAGTQGEPQRFAQVALCVVGAGPAGLATALAAAQAGRSVMLVDQNTRLGGSLLTRAAEIDGRPGPDWVAAAEQALRGRAIVLRRATAFALYDHNDLAVVERGLPDSGERLWRVRAEQIVVAAGAIERPLMFAHNDRPGVMLADAALTYLRRYAVLPGQRAIVATANDSTDELVQALRDAGAEVTVVDLRTGAGIDAVVGAQDVEGARLVSGETVPADLIAVSGGWTPTLHLYGQARGKPVWDSAIGAFRPGSPVAGLTVAGAANGSFDLPAALAEGHAAGGGASDTAPRTTAPRRQWSAPPAAPRPGRVWVDLQNDVTVKDVALALRENFASPEHLKRYTTLGMATDQGKTSNVNGLALLAAAGGRDLATLGPTTFRPPYAPVSFAAIAGIGRGELHHPLRRLPAENIHRTEGACFREYGGLLRPAWYGADKAAIAGECRAARTAATVFDGSPLGKIEVIGPQAPALLDFVFYTRMSTLAPGRLRYGFMLTEGGIVFDDGVVLRLAADHFVVSCSSSHVAAVAAHLEEWRQDRFDIRQVFVHDTTARWGTMAIAGPRSQAIVEALGLGMPLDDVALPHMAMREGAFAGRPVRVARVSFIGERSYEISVPAGYAAALWRAARTAGAAPLGVEALVLLRAEKGFIIVGLDTDGETMPHDIGVGGPRGKRSDAYVGDRSLFTPAALRPDRKQLVGIASDEPIPAGAHAVETAGGRTLGLGFVSSSYVSPTLGRPIALGLIENGRARLGQDIAFEHLGQRLSARLVAPCQLDPEGARLHA